MRDLPLSRVNLQKDTNPKIVVDDMELSVVAARMVTSIVMRPFCIGQG